MEQNIEIEFKNIVEKDEFNKVAQEFKLGLSDFKHQANHYFDTSLFRLKDAGSALRIREKDGKRVLTLKQPYGDGLLETHQRLSEKEFDDAINLGKLPEGQIQSEIEKLGIQFEELAYFGTLETSRAETQYKEGLLVLDHSSYLGTEDYELEYEVEDYHQGKEVFYALLKQLGIPKRETLNKIRRFYKRKLTLETESN
ncbi:CYTH domain-containing protein [Bacillus sp. EB01]|uniref:CYTH domain-containing protein n=1 Tax=Bacillus sp. EB01 TaxID=1347086 RepID=UPI0005C505C6|nr:CYTH domain-containing protein [Bacillus sp. EB01]